MGKEKILLTLPFSANGNDPEVRNNDIFTREIHNMELFLQIIGGIVIGVILLIAGVYLFFRIKFGKYMSLSEDETQTPLIIHLNEDFSPTWVKGKKVKPVAQELAQLGFVQDKSYTIGNAASQANSLL